MSSFQFIKAWEKVAPSEVKLALLYLADNADDDGCGAISWIAMMDFLGKKDSDEIKSLLQQMMIEGFLLFRDFPRDFKFAYKLYLTKD